MKISTSIWGAQHSNAGQNIQHIGTLNTECYVYLNAECYLPQEVFTLTVIIPHLSFQST